MVNSMIENGFQSGFSPLVDDGFIVVKSGDNNHVIVMISNGE